MKKHGFTLIELLIVIAVIALLMGISFPALRGAAERARITRARTEIQTIQQAWLSYWNTYGSLPDRELVMDADTVAILAGNNALGISFMEFDARHLDEGLLSPLRGEDGRLLPYVVQMREYDLDDLEWVYQTRVFLGNRERGRH